MDAATAEPDKAPLRIFPGPDGTALRVGRVRVAIPFLRFYPEAFRLLMNDVIVLDVHVDTANNVLEFIAVSRSFAEREIGSETPNYRALFTWIEVDGRRQLSLSWEECL
jgi:hypothetical protein